MKRAYLTDLRLGEIELTLIPRDRQILNTLRQLRFLRTDQIRRLFFYEHHSTTRAALTATTKTLNRLMTLGLINHLDKRIGGVRTGSYGLVWFITEGGVRLLDLGKDRDQKRINNPDPAPIFLRHTLAVAECYLQIVQICREAKELTLKQLVTEPGCWRGYPKAGKPVSLRPDLYTEVVSGEYEDRWFIEMDLDTESVQSITEKCSRYQEYCQTNLEQKANGVFPLVLWIVPTEDRKQKMIDAIRQAFSSRYPNIHLVITPEELKTTMIQGAKKEDLC